LFDDVVQIPVLALKLGETLIYRLLIFHFSRYFSLRQVYLTEFSRLG
jgi:hypothetical protein